MKMPELKVQTFPVNYDFFASPLWYLKKQTKDYTGYLHIVLIIFYPPKFASFTEFVQNDP